MDEALSSLFKSGITERKLRISSSAGTIQLMDDHNQPGEAFPVKPLGELYDKQPETADSSTRDFMGLLLAIEETFVTLYRSDPGLTDGRVLAALDRLCLSPEADMSHDPLAKEVQFSLRVAFSFGDYTRQEVRHCLRKVKQSVVRHNKTEGTRGYLNFIYKMLRGK